MINVDIGETMKSRALNPVLILKPSGGLDFRLGMLRVPHTENRLCADRGWHQVCPDPMDNRECGLLSEQPMFIHVHLK